MDKSTERSTKQSEKVPEMSQQDKNRIDCFKDMLAVSLVRCSQVTTDQEVDQCILQSIKKFEKCCKDQ